MLPQTENVLVVFKGKGWHPAESAHRNGGGEWMWTKKDATLTFKTPRKDSTLYLDLDNPGSALKEPQHVQLSIGGQPVGGFTVTPGSRC